MSDKTFKTFKEQRRILRDRGLTFEKPQAELKLLSKVNYYILTGYKDLLLISKQPEQYKTDATFKELYDLYKFDRELKTIFLRELLEIEQSIKTMIAYEISRKYGYKQQQYFNLSNFDSTSPYLNANISTLKEQIKKFGKKNKAIIHYKTIYGYIPLWVAVKVLTFGSIHKLYSVLKPNDKDYIAKKILAIDFDSKRATKVQICMQMMVDARNMCAHDEIFFNFLHGSVNIPILEYHNHFDLKNANGDIIKGRKDLFALLIAMKNFMSRTEYRKFVYKINTLINRHMKTRRCYTKDELLEYMKLPKNYIEIIDL